MTMITGIKVEGFRNNFLPPAGELSEGFRRSNSVDYSTNSKLGPPAWKWVIPPNESITVTMRASVAWVDPDLTYSHFHWSEAGTPSVTCLLAAGEERKLSQAPCDDKPKRAIVATRLAEVPNEVEVSYAVH